MSILNPSMPVLMTWALAATILLPLLGAIGLILLPFLSERGASRLMLVVTWLSSAASIVALVTWLFNGAHPFHSPEKTLVSHGEYRFVLGLILDTTAAVFLFLVQFTSGMVIRFSRIYLHREPGFARFFATVLMFRGGMCLLTLADHLDLLFVGWELVGLSSFLLIAFYHERRQAVRNALKTFSVYRVADVGMLLGACLEHTSGYTGTDARHAGIGLLLLLAAAGKSAQFPFSFWIGRAMEGPTPSSALFYGALSVHAGAYLLLRTYSIWGGITLVHICVGLLGFFTAILCTLFSRTQHTIKGQVGYASVTQVGLIFVELALGLRWLALFHIAANALLRCYQLLVSPSAVAYLLRQQNSRGTLRVSDERSLARKLLPLGLRSTLYVFAISEGYLEALLLGLFWNPIRKLGNLLLRFEAPIIGLAVGLVGIVSMKTYHFDSIETLDICTAFAVLAIAFSVISLSCRNSPIRSLAWVSGSSVLSALAVYVALQRQGRHAELAFGLGIVLSFGIALSSMLPVLRIRRHNGRNQNIDSSGFVTAFAFVGVLGIMGFPLLPTFFGEDILLHGAFQVHRVFAVLLSALFAFNEYVAMRAFALTFFSLRY